MEKCLWFLSFLLLWAVCQVARGAPDPEDLMDEQWLEARSPHFHIITDAKEEVALKVVQDLENFRFVVSKMLKVDLVEGLAPARILAMYHKSNFRDLGLPDNWDGVFQQTVDGPYAIANISRYKMDSHETNWGKQVLLHEYVHYVNQNTFAQLFYPPWYSEGMAEYFSTFKFENNEISFGTAEALAARAPSLDYRYGSFRSIGLEELFKARSINSHSKKRTDIQAISRFYAKATLVVHYLNASNENQKALRDYIALINDGYDIDSAFKKSFSRSFKDLEQEVLDYVNKNRLMMRKLTAEGSLKFPVVDIKVKPLVASDFHYQIADFLMQFRHSNKIGFDPVMRLVRKSLEEDPDNAEKKLMVANMLFIDNRHGESQRVLKEILEKYPDNPAALALRGDILFQEASALRYVGFPGWELVLDKARNQYRKAIKRDPFNGRAYYGLGISYSFKMNDERLDEAFVALDSARFFSSDQELPWYEAMLRLKVHDNLKAIPLLRRYVNVAAGENFAVARSLLDLQELRVLTKMPAGTPSAGWHLYPDGSSYEGDWKNGMPEGKGSLVRPNGVKYTGYWKGGLMHGEGEFISSNGYKYIMQFREGDATGTGELIYPDASYKGELLNGMVHGKGEWRYFKDGKAISSYEGTFWYFFRHGPGVFRNVNGPSTPTEWIYGKLKMALSEELTFVGGVNEKGKPHGWGRCVYKKNNKIEWCQYVDGVRSQELAVREEE